MSLRTCRSHRRLCPAAQERELAHLCVGGARGRRVLRACLRPANHFSNFCPGSEPSMTAPLRGLSRCRHHFLSTTAHNYGSIGVEKCTYHPRHAFFCFAKRDVRSNNGTCEAVVPPSAGDVSPTVASRRKRPSHDTCLKRPPPGFPLPAAVCFWAALRFDRHRRRGASSA